MASIPPLHQNVFGTLPGVIIRCRATSIMQNVLPFSLKSPAYICIILNGALISHLRVGPWFSGMTKENKNRYLVEVLQTRPKQGQRQVAQ